MLSDDPDDYAYLADDEVGTAPIDPGTYEGGHAKPLPDSEKMNKWCVRECERSTLYGRIERAKKQQPKILPDFSKRLFNQPWKHPGASS